MFWNTVNKKSLSLSLMQKMVLLYSLTTIAIVILVCIILFPTFEKVNHIYQTNYTHTLFNLCIIKLLTAIFFGITSAIISSIAISKKSTQQIHYLSDKIKNMGADLTTHLSITDLPKELKPLGESFNAMLHKIENSFNQISQFSSDIAHELRNPIHNLLAMNEMALTNQYSVEKHHDIFESNLEECRFLLKLIDNLWFIASSDHGHLSINKSWLDAKKEINEMIEYYDSYASEKEIQISFEGNATLFADSILFKRAISNLLSNALRYTPNNGSIRIKIETDTHYTVISIQDTGIGIEETHLSNLFNRFYRADPSRSMQTGGLGLGLAIVKSIMDLHNGKIEIKSQVNVGTAILLGFK